MRRRIRTNGGGIQVTWIHGQGEGRFALKGLNLQSIIGFYWTAQILGASRKHHHHAESAIGAGRNLKYIPPSDQTEEYLCERVPIKQTLLATASKVLLMPLLLAVCCLLQLFRITNYSNISTTTLMRGINSYDITGLSTLFPECLGWSRRDCGGDDINNNNENIKTASLRDTSM